MILKHLSVKNIRSYESQDIFFPDGSLLLSGDVGSGKTTLLLAIEYALFGLQPGQKGSALLRNNADLGEVALELEVDGKEVIIERRIKRGKSVTNDYASITINGKKTESSLTEVKERILHLLGYPQEFIKKNNVLYRYTVYTPQEQMKKIIEEEPEARLNVLRHVFGIDKYKRIRENLTILSNHLKEDIKMLQMQLQTLEKDRELLNQIKESQFKLKEKISEKDKAFEIKLKNRQEIEKNRADLEIKLAEKVKLESEVEKTAIMIASKKESLISVNNEIGELNSLISETKGLFKQEILEKTLSDTNSKKVILENLNNNLISISSQTRALEQSKKEEIYKKERVFSMRFCPSCLQNVPEAHKHNILNETENKLSDINKQLEKLETQQSALREGISKEKRELESLEETKNVLLSLKSKTEYVEKSSKRLAEITKSRDSLEKDLILLNKHLDGLKEQILVYTKYDNLLKEKKIELQKALFDEKNLEIGLAELKKELELSLKECLRIEAEIKEKEEIQKKLINRQDILDWLSNQFSSLIDFTERNVLIKLRKEFSDLFKNWFMILAGEGFDVHLDESFTPLILQGEFEMDYSFLSGGERTAIALAYRLALNQTINSIMSTIKTKDIIILDEPTEGFSEVQIEKIRDILEQLSIKQLLIVSHEQKIEGFVNTVMKVRKISNVSYILDQNQTMPKL